MENAVANPLTGSFQWTLEDWLLLQKVMMRRSRTLRLFRLVPWIAMAAIAVDLVLAAKSKGVTFNIVFAAIVVVGAFILVRFWMQRALSRHYQTRPERDMKIELTITEDAICSHSEIAKSEFQWSAFKEVLRLQRGFVLFLGNAFLWVPTRAFACETDVQRFEQMVRSHAAQYEDSRGQRD